MVDVETVKLDGEKSRATAAVAAAFAVASSFGCPSGEDEKDLLIAGCRSVAPGSSLAPAPHHQSY